MGASCHKLGNAGEPDVNGRCSTRLSCNLAAKTGAHCWCILLNLIAPTEQRSILQSESCSSTFGLWDRRVDPRSYRRSLSTAMSRVCLLSLHRMLFNTLLDVLQCTARSAGDVRGNLFRDRQRSYNAKHRATSCKKGPKTSTIICGVASNQAPTGGDFGKYRVLTSKNATKGPSHPKFRKANVGNAFGLPTSRFGWLNLSGNREREGAHAFDVWASRRARCPPRE